MNSFRLQHIRLGRTVWLVVLVAVLAGLAAWISAASVGVTYTGRATLTLGSQYRAPEQDAVLASGYADLLNAPGYQQQLRAKGVVPGGVTLSARTAAASPIIYIEATARTAAAAGTAASDVATAFYEDVNTGLRQDRQNKIDRLNAEIERQRQIRDDSPRDSPQSVVAVETMASLQNNVNQLRGDTTNELQLLQRDAGTTSTAPNLVVNVALALVGGAIFGLVAAYAIALLRNRVSSGAQIADRFDVPVVADVRGGRSERIRQERRVRTQRLANLVRTTPGERAMAVAVTSPRRTAATHSVVGLLAERRAEQREATIVLRADLHDQRSADPGPGVADVLGESGGVRLADVLVAAPWPDLQIARPGRELDDPFVLFTAARTTVLVETARTAARFVVVETPPLLEAAEAQTLCSAASHTLLVVETETTKLSEVGEALELLKQLNTPLLGVVVVAKSAIGTPELTTHALTASPEPVDDLALPTEVLPLDPSRNGRVEPQLVPDRAADGTDRR